METEAFLDTHILVWLYSGELERLSPKVKEILEEADLLVSPISLLEMDFLHEIGRLTVRGATIIRSLEEEIGLKVPSDPFLDVISEASGISWTRDPFDRLIVAHAKLRGSSLLTKDRTLRKHYARCVW